MEHKKSKQLYALKYIDKAKCIKQKAVANIIQERRLLEEVSLRRIILPSPFLYLQAVRGYYYASVVLLHQLPAMRQSVRCSPHRLCRPRNPPTAHSSPAGASQARCSESAFSNVSEVTAFPGFGISVQHSVVLYAAVSQPSRSSRSRVTFGRPVALDSAIVLSVRDARTLRFPCARIRGEMCCRRRAPLSSSCHPSPSCHSGPRGLIKEPY